MVTVVATSWRESTALRQRRLIDWLRPARTVLAESRPVVQAVFLMRVLAGTGVLSHPTLHGSETVIGWVALTIAIYVFNGVTDRTADSINQSRRPIASGVLSARGALSWCAALSAIGLGLGAAAGWQVLALAVIMLCLGWSYSAGPAFKNAPAASAIVIGLGAGLTYAAGWASRGGFRLDDAAVATAIAVWVGLSCATKDFSDIEGDRLAGRRTWPVLLGPRAAARVLSLLALVGSALVFLACEYASITIVPAIVVGAGSVALGLSARRNAAAADRSVRRRPYRLFMLTQYVTNGALIALGGT